ncbi:bifunctional DNA primase/polymerase [Nocardia abscessus]|uniref:bifunctional DNA primase/polymerase n=1 Tax=Nocardia abscessus TaxID=120957 RepID=UPI00189485CF|nr:bifunctional DNA primase/polymerase [Nocardia abscessus]MBF6341278.1 bifunctional DNA primase/polymerase [Nocardia abscessus]
MVAVRRGRPSTTLLQAALTAAARGHYVFPLRPRAKTPAYEKHWLRHATVDPDRIRQIWRESPYNVGVACAPSKLLVIDLDTAHGEQAPAPWTGLTHGREVLAAIAAEAGHPYPGPTYTVATPSGGEHLYFTAPETPTLGNSSGRLGWRIDTRGVGGYVVGAGSVSRSDNTYQLLDDRSPTPLPDWLITALTPPPLPTPTTVDLSRVRVNAYVHAALVKQFERILAAPRGQRHHTLLSAAGSIGRLVGARMLTRDEAHQVLRAAAEAHIGIDGFTEREAERVINDGLDFGIARPRHIHLR